MAEALIPDGAGGWRSALRGKFQRDVLWNFGSLGILAASGIALLVLIGRLWGEAELGVFQQVWAAYVILSQAAVGGLDRSALRAVVEQGGDRRRISDVAWGALLPAALSSAFFALAFYAARGPIGGLLESPSVAEGIAAAAPGLFFFGINKVLLAVVNGQRRMRAFALFQSTRYLLMPAGVLVAHALGLPGARVSFLFTFAEGLLFLVLIGDFLRALPRPDRAWRSWVGPHLRYGLKGLLSGMLLELNSRIDVLLLGYLLLEDAPVGVYSVALAVAEGVFQFQVVLQNNYNPILAEHLQSGRLVELEAIVRRGGRVSLLVMLGVAALASACYPTAVRILLPAFSPSWVPFLCLMAGIVLSARRMPFFQTLLMANRPAWHSLFMILVVLVNVIGNALLIPPLGIVGSAAATGLSFVASVWILRLMARRLLGLGL